MISASVSSAMGLYTVPRRSWVCRDGGSRLGSLGVGLQDLGFG